MAIKINDNTITGNIYYNDVKVQKVYINNGLAWEALPENNITLTVYRRVRNGVHNFRIVLTAKYPVPRDITVKVQYNTSVAPTTATIYANEKYGYTGWREGYADMAFITSVSPQSDDTYRYTYTPYGNIEESAPVFNSLVIPEVTQYYYPPSVPVTKLYILRVESQYYVENWTVTATLNIGLSARVTLQNTKSETLSETGKEATRCMWVSLAYPPSTETGYVYEMGPETFRVIDNR